MFVVMGSVWNCVCVWSYEGVIELTYYHEPIIMRSKIWPLWENHQIQQSSCLPALIIYLSHYNTTQPHPPCCSSLPFIPLALTSYLDLTEPLVWWKDSLSCCVQTETTRARTPPDLVRTDMIRILYLAFLDISIHTCLRSARTHLLIVVGVYCPISILNCFVLDLSASRSILKIEKNIVMCIVMVHIHFLLEYHSTITRYNLTNLYLACPFNISYRVRSYRTYWRRIKTSRAVHLPVLDQTLAHPCAGADGEYQAVCRRETVHWSPSRSLWGYQDRSFLRRGVQQAGHCAFRSQVCRWLLCWHWEGESDQPSSFSCIKCSVLYAYVMLEVYYSYGLTWCDFMLAGPQPFLLSSYLHPSFYNMRLSFH